MDYADKVFTDLTHRLPGKYPLADLREPEKFIEAVKFLIDGDWLTDVSFSNDYKILIIKEHPEPPKVRKVTWYDTNIAINTTD